MLLQTRRMGCFHLLQEGCQSQRLVLTKHHLQAVSAHETQKQHGLGATGPALAHWLVGRCRSVPVTISKCFCMHPVLLLSPCQIPQLATKPAHRCTPAAAEPPKLKLPAVIIQQPRVGCSPRQKAGADQALRMSSTAHTEVRHSGSSLCDVPIQYDRPVTVLLRMQPEITCPAVPASVAPACRYTSGPCRFAS